MGDLGTDLSCVTDIDDAGTVVSGRTLLAQAVLRRWSTDRGTLIGYPNYGFDLTQYINADMGDRDIASLQSGASAEALKDERVLSCDVAASFDRDGVLTVVGSLVDSDGPFELTAAISDVTITLLSVA